MCERKSDSKPYVQVDLELKLPDDFDINDNDGEVTLGWGLDYKNEEKMGAYSGTCTATGCNVGSFNVPMNAD